jgi:hypothetical protein
MHPFEKMKVALTERGWHVGWAQGYMQSDGWFECPDDADLDKCLFNIIQDVECYDFIEDGEAGLREQFGIGEDDEETEEFLDALDELYEAAEQEYLTPDQVDGSCFCFANKKTLKEIIPIIEECGCTVDWNGKLDTRPFISWSNK